MPKLFYNTVMAAEAKNQKKCLYYFRKCAIIKAWYIIPRTFINSVMIWKGYNNMDISSIITDVKKDFTRERTSVIAEFLQAHNHAVILSYIKKTRGDSIKFYYLKDGKKCTSDYVVKNAQTLITAFLKNNIALYQYSGGKIEEYQKDF